MPQDDTNDISMTKEPIPLDEKLARKITSFLQGNLWTTCSDSVELFGNSATEMTDHA